LSTLAATLTTVLQRSSRLKQSVADSSFDAWIKYYRQDENAPNSVVSYYQKGALIGLALDLSIRAATAGKRSLDDMMRLLWRQWKSAGDAYRGVAEDEFVQAIEEATELSMERDIAEWTEGTADPDFASLLAPFGVSCKKQPAVDSAHFALLGVKLGASRECKVSHVFDSTPAQAAGISGGDVLIAIGGVRATPANLDTLLSRYSPGDSVEIVAFRRDELMRFEVKLAEQAPIKIVLEVDAKATTTKTRLRKAWLGAR
ncbi:MAG: PDZ domain-containing protein, partial [Burkholderiaceae bacterium]